MSAVVAALYRELNLPILLVCGHLDEADDLADDLELFTGKRPEVLPALELPPNEQAVYAALANEEQSIDEVIRQSGLPSSAVSVALLGLEMKRLIRQLPGKLFVKNR